MSVKEGATGKTGGAATKIDVNQNVKPEELSLPPSPLGSSAFSDTLDQNQTFFPFELCIRAKKSTEPLASLCLSTAMWPLEIEAETWSSC